MDHEMDRILKQALTPGEEPNRRLNDHIMRKAKEMSYMVKTKKSKVPVAVAAALCTLAVGSTAVFAAWKYISPAEVAQEFEDSKLIKAFQGEDALVVNETQEYGGYKVTLLGEVAGKGLSEYAEMADLEDDKFYAVVAIEHADGTPMPDTSDDAYGEEDFYVSPYIKGLDPKDYGIMNLGGGYSTCVRAGIQYRLLEMDNIEMFADQGIYIGVSEGTFYDNDAYLFDGGTGEVTRNEAYGGLNALFTLPIDPAKGDPQAAEAFLKSLEEEDEEESIEPTETDKAVEEWMAKLEAALDNGEPLEKYVSVVESTIQSGRPDAEGVLAYSYDMGDQGAGSGSVYVNEMFQGEKPGTQKIGGYSYSDDISSLEIDICTLNADGTVTFAVYVPKPDALY